MAERKEVQDYFKNLKEEYEARQKKIPRALEIQKRKFLCAIGKDEPTPTKEDDEKVVKECFAEGNLLSVLGKSSSQIIWSDKFATNAVKIVITEHQNFDLRLYLDCAKTIYLTYTGKITASIQVYKAFTYVLTHARSFGDPAQNMFQLENNGSFQIKMEDISKPLPDSVYMRKITSLINDLQTGYDEMKYRILNVNVTYLTLLILRRFVRHETQFLDSFKRVKTHDDYVKLCPHPLHSQLPRISDIFNKEIHDKLLKSTVLLAIHAFLTGNDVKTKRILQATCIQYIEWTGLQMPSLFFKVVRLYKIEESELWDALRRVQQTHRSLHNLAKDYYAQYEMSIADPPETVAWFPYCRALEGYYHKDLSASENKAACMILAYLIDLKIGFEMSFTRNSHWVKNNYFKEAGLKIAKILYKEYPFA